MARRLPPFGAAMQSRQAFTNLPLFVVVTIGVDAWERARRWNRSAADTPAMVFEAGTNAASLRWPVGRCPVVVERMPGPGDDVIVALAKALARDGALSVVIWPREVPPALGDYEYDEGAREWRLRRAVIRVWPCRGDAD